MRKLFEYWGWEDTWVSLVFAFCIFCCVFLAVCFSADRTVRSYYLCEQNDALVIVCDIDWAFDSEYTIKLDRSVSYTDAIKMVEDLNKTLKK